MSELTPERIAEIQARCISHEHRDDDPCRGFGEADIPALLAALDEQAAEIARMRADAECWRKHERGVMRASEQGMAELARLAALTQEATDE